MARSIVIGLNAVIMAVTGESPRVLTVPWDAGDGEALDALPFGPLDPAADRTLELGLRRWVRDRTGLGLGYVEQLYTFGDRDREPGRSPRVLSIAYLALARESRPARGVEARWREIYDYFPWEDWREGRPELLDRKVTPVLDDWIGQSPRWSAQRSERADVAFGMRGAAWDSDRVLERYELLYGAGLGAEAVRDAGGKPGARARRREGGRRSDLGRAMALDHRRILATALGRLRGKIKYRPVIFELLPKDFTLLRLQRVVEALAGLRLHKQNFRRLVDRSGLVEGTGRFDERTGGRPAELFRFRREVLRERLAPGVGLPGLRG